MKKLNLFLLAAIISGIEILVILVVPILDADFYGRLTDTKSFNAFSSNIENRVLPRIRFIIHKILPDENGVEASLELYVAGQVTNEPGWQDVSQLTAEIRDKSSTQSFFVTKKLTINLSRRSGERDISEQSERFIFPYLPSIEGYPLDNAEILPFINLVDDKGFRRDCKIEVQKSFPGWQLLVSKDSHYPKITLIRPLNDRILAIVGGMVFFFLATVMAVGFCYLYTSFQQWEVFLSFVSYIFATVSFRELLGINRTIGTSAYEMIVFFVPIIMLTSVLLILIVRNFIRMKGHKFKSNCGE